MADVEAIAKEFYETYLGLAPKFGNASQDLSLRAATWDDVLLRNRNLLITTIANLLNRKVIMAEPRTQVEERLDNLERAVRTMAAWLVSAQTGFGQKDMEGINDILGRSSTTSEGSSHPAE